ncbi:hypothetical protein QTO34_018567 [Cnephaeus nilssonii]|uniref:Uncharacterized protein n=1 Tax=Cnephaeus nilssonii TaxID=3371016 RepID=A0AA40LQ30_CNENI|nr:hypothetical protein QTO34_018567 [Eptesicus nilssonii]
MPTFVMTINKSQGQTLDRVGIFLPEPVFGHAGGRQKLPTALNSSSGRDYGDSDSYGMKLDCQEREKHTETQRNCGRQRNRGAYAQRGQATEDTVGFLKREGDKSS